ncbi:hypothetical protein ABZ023_25090 [Streptomyces sp. NPDC006367]|uniref:hypothetical protein n=1 Tax=unclassified Streptomyces TaxID=2593676 RepID=UPI0033BABD46
MSDVTRQPGGPAERAPQTQTQIQPQTQGQTQAPGARGGNAPLTGGTDGTVPAPGARADHTAGTRPDVTPGLHTGDAPGLHTGHTPAGGTGAPGDGGLLPHEECDRLGQRLRHAVAEFVDEPRASVEEADRVLEEIAARLADAVAHRRRTLRTSWQDGAEETRATSTDTEQLRLALRDYRELADRLMHV